MRFLKAAWQCASPCHISWRSVEPLPRYGDLSIFKNGGRPPSWICCARVWTTHEWYLLFVGLYHCAEFGWNQCDSFDNMQVVKFCELGLKISIHMPNNSWMVVFFGGGVFYPTNEKLYDCDPYSYIFQVSSKCVQVFWSHGNRHVAIPVLWLLAFTTACTTLRALMITTDWEFSTWTFKI